LLEELKADVIEALKIAAVVLAMDVAAGLALYCMVRLLW
jgi:hypothetical protein